MEAGSDDCLEDPGVWMFGARGLDVRSSKLGGRVFGYLEVCMLGVQGLEVCGLEVCGSNLARSTSDGSADNNKGGNANNNNETK